MASSVVLEREASKRMATSGLVSGSVMVLHSGFQSMRTMTRAQKNLRVSRAPVLSGRAALRMAVMHRAPITRSAMMPIQKVVVVGENTRLER